MSEWIDYFRGLVKSGGKKSSGTYSNDYLAFWDIDTNPEQPLLKMAMGLLEDEGDGYTIPGIVLGSGDGAGNNRAYIEKDADGFKLIYRISPSLVSGIKFDNLGNIYINDELVPPLTDLVLQQQYLSDSNLWNKKLQGLTYDSVNDYYWVGTGKIADGAVTSAKFGTIYANKINTVGLYSERIYKPNHPTNYGVIGGDYADLALYHNGYNYPWFSIYDAGYPGPAGAFRLMDSVGNTTWIMSFDSSGVQPHGAWDCYYSTFDRIMNSDGYQYVTNDQHTTDRFLEVLPNTHNHGITAGTKLAVVNDQLQITGYVAFANSTLSISPQQHNHFIADY